MSNLSAIAQIAACEGIAAIELFVVTKGSNNAPMLHCRCGNGIMQISAESVVNLAVQLNEAIAAVKERWTQALKHGAVESLGAPSVSVLLEMQAELAEANKRVETMKAALEPSAN